MGKNSEIDWTDHTWNIARGCTKISEGCKYCYMMRDGEKFGYNGSRVERTKGVFTLPLKIKDQKSKVWQGPPLVFTSSLTDVMHPDIDHFIGEAFDIMEKCPHLIFQMLTKRPERWDKIKPSSWQFGPENIWMGISVENQENFDRRFVAFEKIPAKVKFLSIEPLLGPVDITPFLHPHKVTISGKSGVWDFGGEFTNDYAAHGRLWVIIGGESGNDVGNYRYRPAELQWIDNIVEQCRKAGVPVFIKQLGTYIAKERKLSDRHGRLMNEFPEHLQIREFPKYINIQSVLNTQKPIN